MNAQDKAKELVNKYLSTGMMITQAKQCAIVAVDEILKDELGIMPAKWMHDYWQEVKNEMQNL